MEDDIRLGCIDQAVHFGTVPKIQILTVFRTEYLEVFRNFGVIILDSHKFTLGNFPVNTFILA